MAAYVFDSSAVMSVLFDEVGAFKVLDLLDKASQGNAQISLPFMALMEIEYWLLRRLPREAQRSLLLVQSWPVKVEESYPKWRHQAARLKAGFPLAVADAWNAALAIIQEDWYTKTRNSTESKTLRLCACLTKAEQIFTQEAYKYVPCHPSVNQNH